MEEGRSARGGLEGWHTLRGVARLRDTPPLHACMGFHPIPRRRLILARSVPCQALGPLLSTTGGTLTLCLGHLPPPSLPNVLSFPSEPRKTVRER